LLKKTMKSFYYIIILISLIGNCPSARAFCIEHKNIGDFENKTSQISNEEAHQLLHDFEYFVNNYHQFLSYNTENQHTKSIPFSGKIHHKIILENREIPILNLLTITGKVRNKDCLHDFVLNIENFI